MSNETARMPNSVLRAQVASRDRSICQYCGDYLPGDSDYTVDHVIPFSRGGPSATYNLVASCHPCNLRKQATVWIPANLSMLAGESPEWADKIQRMANEDQNQPVIEMVRTTLDIPRSLHRRMKSVLGLRGLSVRDYLLEYIERDFPTE